MSVHTTPAQRREFYRRHLRGESYQEVADAMGVSKGCVRYWCRRQRDGGSCRSAYKREPTGHLGRFDPRVRYCILRLRLEHPRWGPNRILFWLGKRRSLKGLKLPSEASIGRYLHQWPKLRRQPRPKTGSKKLDPSQHVHQRWQLDFKVEIALEDGTLVNLHTVRDPVGEACIGAFVFASGKVGSKAKRVSLEQVRSVLRTCFTRWGTLPEEIQTDGEPCLIGQVQDTFPSEFTLWLKGLGIEHLVTRPGRPTDNAEVERCHRTVNEYAIVGNEHVMVAQLQTILDAALHELNYDLPSRAQGCKGLPPLVAHPDLLVPRRPFQPELELVLFDMNRVDAHLATFVWERKVGKTGQIEIGCQRYSVGRAYARTPVLVRFNPEDRHFVFYRPEAPEEEIGRRKARGLDVGDLTGLATWPEGLGPQQLPLPLIFTEGVYC